MSEANPLRKLEAFGQSIWLDLLRRGMIVSGELQQLVDEDGLSGETSNPAIFEKAIGGSHDYDEAIRELALAGKRTSEIYEALTVEDVRRAADLFRPIYDRTQGEDGFVSLEVSPHLAHNTAGTIAEARRLWTALDRPNVLIKVPATLEGLPAIQQLIAEGINVNVTLLFGLPRYQQVLEAYMAGLEERVGRELPLERVASVASFFLSRIDVLVDPMLEQVMSAGGPMAEVAAELRGQVAIASARQAYQIYLQVTAGRRFGALQELDAHPQRLLWASTSTKNPLYSDVKYIDALIGPHTVNTVPLETLHAYRDHGNPAMRLEEGLAEAGQVFRTLRKLNISLQQVTQQLEDEGVAKFSVPFDRLLETIEAARVAALAAPVDPQVFALGEWKTAVEKRLHRLERISFTSRLWRKDGSLWVDEPEEQGRIHNALGWLHVAEKMEENLAGLDGFLTEVKAAGFSRVVHLGMGGSSLAPLVFQRTFSPTVCGLPLTVLDTTDPGTISRVEQQISPAHTLFIVASKSGITAETLALGDFFYALVRGIKGDGAGENLVAITDPGTPLARLAQERGFRRILVDFPDIGGRYSALSYLGLVPAALMGLDVGELLAQALRMVHACAASVPLPENVGAWLGAVLGELARQGRDKLTLLLPEPIAALGMWLEQLLAESTGKAGRGILPVAGEPLGEPEAYGQDRVFAHFVLGDQVDERLAQTVAGLRQAGHPVITLRLDSLLDLGQEFFRWEFATATAGAILRVNAFDQPNVQESKDNTSRLLALVQERGHLPPMGPALVEDLLDLQAPGDARTIPAALARFLGQARRGDYVTLLAYLTETPAGERALQSIRKRLRDGLHLATTLGYGLRFLHSTGQYHKGGPNRGLFLQLTTDDVADVPIPQRPYTFGLFSRAKALGDLQSLHRHRRRVLHIHLHGVLEQALLQLDEAIRDALRAVPPVDW